MRILHLNQYGTHVGGVEGYISDVSSALIEAGHSVGLVYFSPHDRQLLLPDAMYVPLEKNSSVGERCLVDIQRAIDAFKPDVAFIHAVYQPEIVSLVKAILPSLAYVHGPYLVCPGNALFLRRSAQVCGRRAGPGCLIEAQVERCCFGRNPIDHVQRLWRVRSLLEAASRFDTLVGSEFMRRKVIANGLLAQRINVVAPFLVNATLPEYRRPADPKEILFGGRLTSEKGCRQLIQALALVPEDWHLIVAGDGPDQAACQSLAERLDIIQRIEFVGWVEPAQMMALYQRCAFVVMPSLWPEPYGRIGPEAFIHGRPVVAYAVGGIPDWLEDEETGYLAVPGDVGSLSAAIARLVSNANDQERMGQTARERARVRWNAETHVQVLAASFRAAIDGISDGIS